MFLYLIWSGSVLEGIYTAKDKACKRARSLYKANNQCFSYQVTKHRANVVATKIECVQSFEGTQGDLG